MRFNHLNRLASIGLAGALLLGVVPAAAVADVLDPIPLSLDVSIKTPEADTGLNLSPAAFLTDDTVTVIFEGQDFKPVVGRIYDRGTGAVRSTFDMPDDLDGITYSVTEGDALIIGVGTNVKGYLYNALDVFDTATMTRRYRIMPPEGQDRLFFGGWAVAAAGRVAVASSAAEEGKSGRVYVFDLETGEELYHIEDPLQPSGFFGFLQSYEGKFPGPLAMTESHIAVAAGPSQTGMQRVHLFDAATGEPVGEVKKEDMPAGIVTFGTALALDENRLYATGELRTNVRIAGGMNATTGKVYALELADLSVSYTLDDPVPLAADTPPAALAAALGEGVPFYGAKFGDSLVRNGETLFVGMPDYPAPVPGAGAVIAYDAASGVPRGMIQSSAPLPNSNFLLIDTSENGVAGYSQSWDDQDVPSRIDVFTPD